MGGFFSTKKRVTVAFAYGAKKVLIRFGVDAAAPLWVHCGRMPDDLEPYLSRLCEEGDALDCSAFAAPSGGAASVSGLWITRQDARRSRFGRYYEIHGRSGLVTVLRGSLDVLLDGCPLSLSQGLSFTYFPFQTRYLIRESPDALLCCMVFDDADATERACLHNTVFGMPEHWKQRYSELLRSWLERDVAAAAGQLKEQIADCARLYRQTAAPLPPLFADLQALLAQQENYALRVKELATRLGLTPNYLNSAYRDFFGVPLGSYLEHRRFDLSIALLSDPDLPIRTIAAHVGFLTTSSFCRKMRIWCGLTPQQIREIMLSDTPRVRFTASGQYVC